MYGQEELAKSVKKDVQTWVDLEFKTLEVRRRSSSYLASYYAVSMLPKRMRNTYKTSQTKKWQCFTQRWWKLLIAWLSKQDKEYITKSWWIAYEASYKRFAEACSKQASGVDLGFTENYAGSIHYKTNPEETSKHQLQISLTLLQKHVTGIQNSAEEKPCELYRGDEIINKPNIRRYTICCFYWSILSTCMIRLMEWEALLKDNTTRGYGRKVKNLPSYWAAHWRY